MSAGCLGRTISISVVNQICRSLRNSRCVPLGDCSSSFTCRRCEVIIWFESRPRRGVDARRMEKWFHSRRAVLIGFDSHFHAVTAIISARIVSREEKLTAPSTTIFLLLQHQQSTYSHLLMNIFRGYLHNCRERRKIIFSWCRALAFSFSFYLARLWLWLTRKETHSKRRQWHRSSASDRETFPNFDIFGETTFWFIAQRGY